jgi:5'-deoxynucleotidase YfbR-like HD superfamily hydrolase
MNHRISEADFSKIRTLSGRMVDIMNPTPDMFDIEDIAHGLSFQCRFAGQIPEFFTVAQHSINVSKICPQELRMAALLHDAPEFIMGDLASPIKTWLPNYKEIENRILEVIAKKFGFQYPLDTFIKTADQAAFQHEYRNLITGLRGPNFIVMSSPVAKANFLAQYHKLKNF